MRTRTFTAASMAECLQMAKQELGLDAMIVSKRTFRQGAVFGRWGGRPMVEVTFGTYRAPSPASAPGVRHGAAPSPSPSPAPVAAPEAEGGLQTLEARVASLADSVQNLLETNGGKGKNGASPFVSAPVEARGSSAAPPNGTLEKGIPSSPAAATEDAPDTPDAPAPKPLLARRLPRRSPAPAPEAAPEGGYPALLRQLLDADVAPPLARQLLADVPPDLATAEAASVLRTLISQRLRIAPRPSLPPGDPMRLLALVGTTGVGKTTTIAKLAAQYALLERRRVGIVTLDTNRIAAAQQMQTYGQILRVPVQVARDKPELVAHLVAYKAEGMEIVLIDTAGRSPNDMLPMGETGHLFEDLGLVQKFLAVPATLAARDLENIVARFQSLMPLDALILTKLDEASDNACFGRLLTLQAKCGLPVAYVTTGQKVPDDIMFPDSHAIAARILN